MNKLQKVELEQEDEHEYSAFSPIIDIKEPFPKEVMDIFRDYRDDDRIILQPEFQRDFIWNKKRQEALIRSLWKGIPLPMFYFSVSMVAGNERWEVIDGQQRLTTIFGFINSMSIKDKTVRGKITKKVAILDSRRNKVKRSDIVSRVKRRQIYCVLIPDKGLNVNEKYDIFKALNQGAVSLKAQELRNAMLQKEAPDLNKELKTCARLLSTLLKIRNDRMIFEELVLRFFIISERGYDKKVSNQLQNIEDLKDIFGSKAKAKKLSKRFKNFLNLVKLVFRTKKGFHKYFQVLSKDENRKLSESDWDYYQFSGKINQGLYHLLAYFLPQFDTHQINKSKPLKIRQGFVKILKNPKFIKLITGSATDSTKVIRESRNMFERKFIIPYIGNPAQKDAKTIPKGLRKVLLGKVPFCYLCYGKLKEGQKMHAEHIEAHAKGHPGSYHNILLAHEKCNLSKGVKKLADFRENKKSIKMRIKNQKNIDDYLTALKKWHNKYRLNGFDELVRYAKRDRKL